MCTYVFGARTMCLAGGGGRLPLIGDFLPVVYRFRIFCVLINVASNRNLFSVWD